MIEVIDVNRKYPVPLEEYSIIFTRSYIDCDGKKHQVEEPLIIKKLVEMGMPYGVYTLNAMLDEMKSEILMRCTKEGGME